jgi:hypothetical protein
MRYPIRGSLALLMACVLLGAGEAPACDAPQAPMSSAQAMPSIPVPVTVDGAQSLRAYADHELTDAEKEALAKQRLERCRLHPGTCMQGAEHAKDGKIIKPEPAVPSGPPPESAEK